MSGETARRPLDLLQLEGIHLNLSRVYLEDQNLIL